MSSIDDWLRGELHDVVGYYDKTLAQFLLSLAHKAPGPQALHSQLLASGIDEGPKVKPFAEQLFRRVQGGGGGGGGRRPAAGAGGGGMGGHRQPTNAELIRQSQQYGMVESDDEEFALALGGGGGKKKVGGSVGVEVDGVLRAPWFGPHDFIMYNPDRPSSTAPNYQCIYNQSDRHSLMHVQDKKKEKKKERHARKKDAADEEEEDPTVVRKRIRVRKACV